MRILAVLTALAFLGCNTGDKVDFSAEVKPILNKHCISCHGGVKKSGGFSVLFEEEAMAATKSGHPAIVRGEASKSEFIKRLHEKDPELRMPYKKPPLSKEEIATLTKWVDQGAKWGKHWAYSPPKQSLVPSFNQEASFVASSEGALQYNEIDYFIQEELKKHQLEPAPIADSLTLLRRLSFNITGLPPSEEIKEDWINGSKDYDEVVTYLLNSKNYGEHWASWWLDQARYANTKGYEQDRHRNIWRYRDWVITSFNQDKPFDEFTIEQLAGDLLPEPTEEQIVATAFHRNTMNNDEGGTDNEEFRLAAVMDRLHTTFDTWQSTTISCVQCHSHPYDPFKHEEYYGLMAFFNNTLDQDTEDEKPNILLYDSVQQQEVDKLLAWVEREASKNTLKKYEEFLKYESPFYLSFGATDIKNGVHDMRFAVQLRDGGSCVFPNVNANQGGQIIIDFRQFEDNTHLVLKKGNKDGPVLLNTVLKKEHGLTQAFSLNTVVENEFDLYVEVGNKNIARTKTLVLIRWLSFLEDLEDLAPEGGVYAEKFAEIINMKTEQVPILYENPMYNQRTTHVFERGNWMEKGDEVAPETPDILNEWNPKWPKNRLGFSYWLMSKDNPLTARTLVNKVWAQLYGNGFVTTLEDMGTQSDTPIHPELLDYLSVKLVDEFQWSIKELIRYIVMSRTYQQSSKSNALLFEKDPHNLLYARGPRLRLSAEEIRDQALFVSGLLSDKMYGPSVMPPQPDGVWQTVYNGRQWEESKGEDKYRRAVYTYLKRTSPYPAFLTFDAGSREVCLIDRTTTNTPLQALVTLNDPVYLEAAYFLAKQMDAEPEITESIGLGYSKALLKPINKEKLAPLVQLYKKALADFEANPEKVQKLLKESEDATARLAALTVVANAIMNLDEFIVTS
ncbi:PSD1 and planctomycete cytochrome C domain-containing protein [Galbibacter mesophilus]|uniref:PSD1 and planctomycete cytochrome C domain-containing protein n=1 Tax=Galbibacter mesophilus TaxID=379069 RepID=UPI001F5CAC73|nr:PSD1 and planctomycete cytochrome C domain-containing protein [Galbibacter mesophilus]MCM5661798.1 PSD1 and planctomycete cytochrome C domain-containing protein [Galbibacter mesophilus]